MKILSEDELLWEEYNSTKLIPGYIVEFRRKGTYEVKAKAYVTSSRELQFENSTTGHLMYNLFRHELLEFRHIQRIDQKHYKEWIS